MTLPLSVHPSICPSVHPSIHQSTTYLSIHSSIYCLSSLLSTRLFLSPFLNSGINISNIKSGPLTLSVHWWPSASVVSGSALLCLFPTWLPKPDQLKHRFSSLLPSLLIWSVLAPLCIKEKRSPQPLLLSGDLRATPLALGLPAVAH